MMGGFGQVGEVGDSLGLGFFEWMAQVGEIDGGRRWFGDGKGY